MATVAPSSPHSGSGFHPQRQGSSHSSASERASTASHSTSGGRDAAAATAAATGSRRGSDKSTASSLLPVPTSTNKSKSKGKGKGKGKRSAQDLDDGSDALPTRAQVLAADDVVVRDRTGRAVRFGTLRRRGVRTVLLFVRHQHCGLCLTWLSGLNDTPAFRALAAAPEGARRAQVIIVSQGSWTGIERYAAFSGPVDAATGEQAPNPFEIVSSADGRLFEAYGVTKRSWRQGADADAAPEVQGLNTLAIVLKSLKETLGSGVKGILGGGDYDRLGADFVIGEDDTPIYAHRMRTTRDHTGAEKLAQIAGLTA